MNIKIELTAIGLGAAAGLAGFLIVGSREIEIRRDAERTGATFLGGGLALTARWSGVQITGGFTVCGREEPGALAFTGAFLAATLAFRASSA